jgi:hypothetical protein
MAITENESIPNPPAKSLGEKLNTWVQTVGIVIGSIIVSLWGLYAFYYKEIYIPKSAPVNITLDLLLKKSDVSETKRNSKNQRLYAIEMKVAAKNPSSRTIYLFPNRFVVYGLNTDVTYSWINDGYENFVEKNISNIKKYFCGMLPKHSPIIKRSLIVVGELFTDKFLKPNEMVGRTLIFHVPRGEYDMLEVFARIPTNAKDTKKFTVEYYYDKQNDFDYALCRITADGKVEPLKADEKGEYIDASKDIEYQKIEYQASETNSMISLW